MMCIKRQIQNSSQIKALLFFILIMSLTKIGYAEKLYKPLWTPEKAVTYPIVSMNDISPDGRYSLIEVLYTSIKEDSLEQFSQCILVDNKNLQSEKIGVFHNRCGQPQFIKDGKKFSYIIYDKDNKASLYVKDIATGNLVKSQEFDRNFVDYRFAPNGDSFVFTAKEDSPSKSRLIEGKDTSPKKSLYLQRVSRTGQLIDKPQLLNPPSLNIYSEAETSYAWSSDSKKIALTTGQPIWMSIPRMSIYLIDVIEGKVENLGDGINSFDNLMFSPDGEKLVFFKIKGLGEQKLPLKTYKEINSKVIQVIDLKTRNVINIDGTDIWTIVGWTEDGNQLIVTTQAGTKQQLYFLNIDTQKLTPMETSHLTGVSGAVLSKDRKHIGFLGQSFYHPAEAFVLSLENFAPKQISFLNKDIDLSAIPADTIKWKSSDGEEIQGILVYPQGYKAGKRVPLIVSIHGGPAAVESEKFIGDTWFGSYSPAVFSSEGFATLVINYRGSLGYGTKFQNLIYKNIGKGDFQDVMSGVDYLIDQGIADPRQLFIRGHSYGGFMSAWAIGHTNRFNAACVSAGIVDWISDAATADISIGNEATFGGAYWENYDLWRKASPISYVRNITTPTLILQGQNDKRVPWSQSQQLYQALKEKKVPARFVLYFGEEHHFSSAINTVDAMQETMTWFKKYRDREGPVGKK